MADPDDESVVRREPTHRLGRVGRGILAFITRIARAVARLVHWGSANTAAVVTVVAGGAFVLAIDLLAAEVYEAVTEREGLETLDRPVLDAAVELRTPAADAVIGTFTTLGGVIGMSVIAVVLTAVLALARRSWTPVVLMAVAASGSVLMTVLGKDLVGRSRPPTALAVPPLETSPSFPSGHTLNATVLIGMLAYLVLLGVASAWWRSVTVVAAVLFVLAMGLSRVYLGHHWLTDVIAGWLLGVGWLATVVTAHRTRLVLQRSET